MTRPILSVCFSNLTGVWNPDEEGPFFFFGSFVLMILAPSIWLAWYSIIAQVNQLASSDRDRLVLYLTLPICLSLLALFLLANNPGDPRQWTSQLLLGYIICAFWLGLLIFSPSFLGIEAKEDVAERRNVPASWAIAGGQLGLTLCFAGTVVGHGRPWQVCLALLPGALGTLVLLGLWAILEWFTNISDAITVDRDGGSALRLAGFLAALGLVLGQYYVSSTAEAWKLWIRFIFPIGLLFVALLVESWHKISWDYVFGHPRRKDLLIALAYSAAAGLGLCLTR